MSALPDALAFAALCGHVPDDDPELDRLAARLIALVDDEIEREENEWH